MNFTMIKGSGQVLVIFLTIVCGINACKKTNNNAVNNLTYKIVHTGVTNAYTDIGKTNIPNIGQPFFGQDANYLQHLPSYTDNKNGTITDNITGLVWEKEMGEKMTLQEAQAKLNLLNSGSIKDWRIPSIKELYSLAIYNGQVFGDQAIKPFIDTNYFKQPKGDITIGEREIDAQTWSSTNYQGLTMGKDSSRFGMNFVDGRIKAYPLLNPMNQLPNKLFFRMVRGNTEYGKNYFVDNKDGTVSDLATGLIWQKADARIGMNWEEALQYAQTLTLAGKLDWRLPSIKELQSIVNYSRCPQTTNTAAIDTIFNTSTIIDPQGNLNYPFYWSATTLLDGPNAGNGAAYVCFGDAQGKNFSGQLVDAHGAGAVRSDPKSGNKANYPQYFGPQGDVLYVYNYVRCVRNK
jgi:hypothetical protein